MRSSWETSPSSSAYTSSCEENEELTPTQLLSLAIKKRRALYESKDRNYRKELLHTGMIQSLCKFLGEGRALRKKSRGSKRKHRSQNSQKSNIKPVDLPKKYAISNEQLENMDQSEHVDPPKNPISHAHEPTMLELNGASDDGDDAVVPVMKRPKYEQVFETEPTEQEKEIIKEYVYEDFFSSLVSFYTPNEYYSSVEPTKDLYWCCDDTDSMYELEFMPNPPDIEFLALCS